MKEGAVVFDPNKIEDLQFSTEKQILTESQHGLRRLSCDWY